MADPTLQKDAMDVLQAWVDQYNLRAGGRIELDSGGEAGGAQLRLKYVPADGTISRKAGTASSALRFGRSIASAGTSRARSPSTKGVMLAASPLAPWPR